MNKIIISIFILLWVAVGAMAQTATVTGTVTDDIGTGNWCHSNGARHFNRCNDRFGW